MEGSIGEREISVAGLRLLAREKGGAGMPTVFVHGNPTSSTDWLPFLERLEGPGFAFDLPGFGRSERPDPARFPYTMWSYADLIEEALDALTPERYRLVVHDWGAIALSSAARDPERVDRLVVVDAVPLLAGYRWHWVARLWRRRGLGEALNATTTRASLAALLRQARPGFKPMPADFVDEIWADWKPGTREAVLRLYRSADPDQLALAGRRLGELRCPALVVWGQADPYIAPRFGAAYVAALPGATLVPVEGAGHWPWIDRPELVGEVTDFLAGG